LQNGSFLRLIQAVPLNSRSCKLGRVISENSGKSKRDRIQGLPVWVRAPGKGPEYWSGFSRSKLYELSKDRKIRSVSIREPGQKKGTRLFHLKSILAFIETTEKAA
jgi:hypothetical protein